MNEVRGQQDSALARKQVFMDGIQDNMVEFSAVRGQLAAAGTDLETVSIQLQEFSPHPGAAAKSRQPFADHGFRRDVGRNGERQVRA
jgi:hypothetical protein